VKIVVVPKIAELSANVLAGDAYNDPDIKKYLPDIIKDDGTVKHINR
jgi:hypothetical protein